MLFVVASDAASLLRLETRQPSVVIAAFSRLLSNYSDGHHVLLMEPDLCRFIEDCPLFSADERGSAKKIRNRYADYGALTGHVKSHAQVVSAGRLPIRTGDNWKIPLQWLAENPLRETSLICEDLNDVSALRAAASDHLSAKRLHAFTIRTAGQQGGGGNTHKVLDEIANQRQQLCICVVDSDRKFPGGPIGPTAKPCVDFHGPGLFTVEVTAGRTIENSIPWRLIDQVRANYVPIPSTDLAELERRKPGVTQYLNFKRGICGFEIAQLDGDNRRFWDDVATSIKGAAICCTPPCTVAEQPLCKYKPHRGFGNSLLTDVSTWTKANESQTRSAQYLPSPNDADWKRLGEMVFSYGLGLPKRRL